MTTTRCAAREWKTLSSRTARTRLLADGVVDRCAMSCALEDTAVPREQLRDAGFDVFLLDWGVADERDAGNTLEDYVDAYLPTALARACKVSSARHLNLVGYCFGGVLVLLSAAHQPGLPVRSLGTVATPADFSQMSFTELSGIDVNSVVDDTGNVPATVIRQAFRVLMPTVDTVQYADLLEHLWNDDYVLVYQAVTRWINDHVPFPGAAARQVSEMIVRENGMVQGTVRLGGDRVTLANIRYPLLNVVATRDNIVPPAAARPILGLVGPADKEELVLGAGHIGLVFGGLPPRRRCPSSSRSCSAGASRTNRESYMHVEELTTARLSAVERFLRDLSELDRTFIKEDLSAATVASWASPDQCCE